MNTNSHSTGSLVFLSTQLLEESLHEHPASLAPDHCPSCWTRKMALELIEWMRSSAPTPLYAEEYKAAQALDASKRFAQARDAQVQSAQGRGARGRAAQSQQIQQNLGANYPQKI